MCYTDHLIEPMDTLNVAMAEPLRTSVEFELLSYKETGSPGRNSSSTLKIPEGFPSVGLNGGISRARPDCAFEPGQEPPSVEHLIGRMQKCRDSQHLASSIEELTVACNFGLEGLPVIGNHLILAFMACGSVTIAQQAFDRLPLQDELIYTSLMHGYVECEQGDQALSLLDRIYTDFENFTPPLFVALLRACARLKWTRKGQELHADIAKQEFERDLKVSTALIDMYGKCGAVAEARDVFDNLSDRDVVLWTALIWCYAEHGCCEEALSFLDLMIKEGVPVNEVTYVCSLKACSGLGDVARGLKLHTELSKDGLETNLHIFSTLVDMYAQFGLLEEACALFNKYPMRNVVSWNALVTGYVEHGLMDESLTCVDHMQSEGISPNAITHVCSLKACCSLQDIEKGQELHASINKMGYESDIYLGSILVDMYASCGFLDEAEYVFGQLPFRDVVAWTALIRGYTEQGLIREAFGCLEQMQREGIHPNAVTYVCMLKECSRQGLIEKGRMLHSEIVEGGLENDSFVGNTLVDVYAKCGWVSDAVDVFKELSTRTVVSWNTFIAAYTEYGYFEEALLSLEQMELDLMSPDAITYIFCLKACGSVGAMEKGQELHMKIVKVGFEKDPYLSSSILGMDIANLEAESTSSPESLALALANAVIDMYGKCGSMIDSQKLFDETELKDICTWTALVSGYSRMGEFKLVFSLFKRMERESIKPDGVIFLGLLNVCSHEGLMDKGHNYFDRMRTYGIRRTIEHHNCMIDLYGRAGILERALLVLDRMPCEPDFISWSTVLCACRRWGQMELGRQAFECAMKARKGNAAWYITMSNIYAASQMSEE